MKHEKSYGIIPLRKRNKRWEVLLVQLYAGHWGFPKGHAEPGESPSQAAERELKEETGLIIKQLLSESVFEEAYQFSKHGALIHKTVYYYAAEVQGDVKPQVEEIKATQWIPFNDAEAQITFPTARETCRRAIKALQL